MVTDRSKKMYMATQESVPKGMWYWQQVCLGTATATESGDSDLGTSMEKGSPHCDDDSACTQEDREYVRNTYGMIAIAL